MILVSCIVNGQNIAINATGAAPANSAILDVASINSGILIPRMTAAQKTAIAAPSTGLLIYQTDASPGFYYFDGIVWIPMAASAWNLTGNAGTNIANNFIGTGDNVALRMRTNNLQRFEITSGTAATGGHLRASNNGTAAAPTYSFTASATTGVFRPAANMLGFSTNGGERFRINNLGQVLINSLVPTDPNQFEVRVIGASNYWGVNSYNNTTQGGAGFFVNNSSANGFNALESVTYGTNSGVWGWHAANFGNGYGVRGNTNSPAVAWAGYFVGDVGAVGFFNISDARWKRNVRSLKETSILNKVMQLQPKSYQYNASPYPGMGFDSTRTTFGFIAQDLSEIFPEVVTNKKGIPDPTVAPQSREEVTNVSGYYLVDYIALIPVLTQAIQEQQEMIDALLQEIELLKTAVFAE